MPKDLFSSDDDSGADEGMPQEGIRVNRTYASKYDQVKRKQELQRLSSKYGADADTSSDEEDADEGSEDDDAHYLTAEKEVAFAEVFHKIRTNPEEILQDKSKRFFDVPSSDASLKRGEKPFLLKDEYQRALASGAVEDDEVAPAEVDDAATRKLKPKTAHEKKLRDAFIASTKQSADDFDVTLVSKGPKPSAEATAKQRAASLLHEAFQSSGAHQPTNDDEKFLERFFVDELWKGGDDASDDEAGTNWDSIAKDEQDEMFYDEAEQWEREYQDRQFRHEDGEAALAVQTFSRSSEGLLRKKDETRKQRRERREERKYADTNRQVEELKRLKTLKRKEIEEQKQLIASVAGVKNLEKLGITREFLEKDFDPVEFDKQMAAIFDHDYDHEIDDEEVALFENEDDAAPEGEGSDDSDAAEAAAGSDVDDDFADTLEESVANAAARFPHNKGRNAPQFLQDDELAMLYPDEALKEMESLPPSGIKKPSGGKSQADLEQALERKMDEYWKLHYHKVAGDVRTRFRYRDVNAESFCLTDIDVLTKDDRQLNMIAPLNCYAPYLGKNENLRDRYKAQHRRNSLREISTERKSRRYGDLSKTAILNESVPEEEGQKIAQRIKEGTKRLRQDDLLEAQPGRGPRHEQRNTNNHSGQHQRQSGAPPQQRGEHRRK